MRKFRKRIMVFYVLLSIVMMVLIGRLVYIQVFWSDALTAEAKAQQNKKIPIPAERGSILDRNGDKMAFSVKMYSVWAHISDIKKPTETANIIAETLEADPLPIIDKIITSQKTLVKVLTNLTKSEADLLKSKGIYGISITEDSKRIYPYNTLASHLIGNVKSDGDGFLGIELYFNELLKGTAGMFYVTTDVYGRQLAYGEDTLDAPINGQSIKLTIDDSIQYFVEDRLKEAMALHDAKSVSAIVMDPRTGEIIAMTSKPDFNLNDPRAHGADIDEATWNGMTADEKLNYSYSIWNNKVISNTYEPGSTFKAFIAAIALEEKLITLDTTFFCNGFKEVNGVKLHCVSYPEGHGHQTFVQAFVNSCNPAFIEVGQKIGVETMYEYFEKFGLFEKTNVSLPAEARSIPIAKEKVGPVELAAISFGHSINVTMLQMTRTLAAMVNGGYLMEPQIVSSIIDQDGNVVSTFEKKVVSQIISEETSEQLKYLLESAVKTGGGKKAFIEGIRVGGKSGTTQKFTVNGYEDEVVVVSFVGIVPINDPEYIILVVVDEPKDEFLGSLVAAPIVKNVMEDILRYKNIVPDVTETKEVAIPNLIGLTLEEAQKLLDELGLTYSVTPLGVEDLTLKVTNQFPESGTKVGSNSIVILSVGE